MSGEEILRYYHMNGKNRGFTVDRRGIIRVGLVPPPEILEHIDNPSVLIGRTWKAGERLIRFEEVTGTHRSPSPSPTNPTGSYQYEPAAATDYSTHGRDMEQTEVRCNPRKRNKETSSKDSFDFVTLGFDIFRAH
uniref:Uncharacterized protein n=1 Tax=Helianthus annuus TaxID=4232 RepID=A0A251VRI8_HELAN